MGRKAIITALVTVALIFLGPSEALEFRFSVTIDGLGTKKVKRGKLEGGTPLVYPVDEFDLVERVKPAIEKFRSERRRTAITEARSVLEDLKSGDLRIEMILMARKVLGTKELSDSFYTHHKAELKKIEKILGFWATCSRDVSRVKFWNHAMRSEKRDRETEKETYHSFVFSSEPGESPLTSSLTLTIRPPYFLEERGMGFIDLNRSVPRDPRLPLDIPITADTGSPLEDVEKQLKQFLQNFQTALGLFSKNVLQNDLRLYLAESMLRNEINCQLFEQANISEAVPNALARYALSRILLASSDANSSEIIRRMILISPATPKLEGLISDIEKLNLDSPPSNDAIPDLKRAYTYLLAGAMLFDEPLARKDDWEIIRKLTEDSPAELGAFFEAAHEVFPELEEGFTRAKVSQLEALRESLPKNKEKPEPGTPEIDEMPLPDDYQTSRIGGMAIQHPKELKEALSVLGPAWGKGIKKRREQFNAAMANRPWLEIQKLTDEELDRLEAFGLKLPQAKHFDVENWAEMIVKLAEMDRLFHLLFTNQFQIWIKEDVQKILQDGGELDGFSQNEEEGTISYSLDLANRADHLSYEEMKQPGVIEKMQPVVLPIVFKRAEIEGKSKEELIALLNDHEFIGAFQKDEMEVGKLAQSLGLRPLGMTETFCFNILIHELTETSITENLIASKDRRWFTDGMATYLAAEMTSERFGDEAGWKHLEKIYKLNPNHRDELLGKLDLFGWPPGEIESRIGREGPTILSNARYLYSAKAIRKAVDGRGPDFVRRWHAEIARTRWNRTNSKTVIEAYRRLTGEDLTTIVESIAEE